MTTLIKGQLQIDHDRGVIYFHVNASEVEKLGTVTALRICRLPTPIPEVNNRLLDITHMYGCNWGPPYVNDSSRTQEKECVR